MWNDRGFTLVEVVVGGLVGAVLVVAIGLLGQNLVHQRTSADSESAAISLAERALERLKSPGANLTAGSYGPYLSNGGGATTLNGPFSMQWSIIDNTSSSTSPLVSPTLDSKRLTVTVTHVSNPHVRASFTTYHKAS
jgi:Tfp pilus assembly protein PilV